MTTTAGDTPTPEFKKLTEGIEARRQLRGFHVPEDLSDARAAISALGKIYANVRQLMDGFMSDPAWNQQWDKDTRDSFIAWGLEYGHLFSTQTIKLICPRCGADRYKEPCRNESQPMSCPMTGRAYSAHPAQAAAGGEKCCGDFDSLVDAPECKECPSRQHYLRSKSTVEQAAAMPEPEICHGHYVKKADYDTLSGRCDALADALTWVLPMAKGYAHEHPVGGNQDKCDHAEKILRGDK